MSVKKKLIIINGAQFGHSSGHYFYSKYLLDDFEIKYICYDRGLDRITLSGVEVHYIPFTGSKVTRLIRFLTECSKQCKVFKPDILFVTYFNSCSVLSLICKSKKKILDIRTGSLYENKIYRSTGNLIIRLQSLFYRNVIVLSESMRKRLNLSIKKSRVIPLGSEIYFEKEHSFNDIKLLYVGTLDDRNIYQTISGLGLYLQRNINIPVVSYTIIGFGTKETTEKLKTSIYESNVGHIVKFEGRKTFDELIPYFELSNVGVVYVPQTDGYDCQPVTKLFEYLLSGMPVIATNTYENRVIVNSTNGILINDSPQDFCSGLEEIIKNKNSYYSSKIRQSVANFTWEEIVNSNLKPYLLSLL